MQEASWSARSVKRMLQTWHLLWYIRVRAVSVSYEKSIQSDKLTYTVVSSGIEARVLFNAVCISSAEPSKNLPQPMFVVNEVSRIQAWTAAYLHETECLQ